MTTDHLPDTSTTNASHTKPVILHTPIDDCPDRTYAILPQFGCRRTGTSRAPHSEYAFRSQSPSAQHFRRWRDAPSASIASLLRVFVFRHRHDSIRPSGKGRKSCAGCLRQFPREGARSTTPLALSYRRAARAGRRREAIHHLELMRNGDHGAGVGSLPSPVEDS